MKLFLTFIIALTMLCSTGFAQGKSLQVAETDVTKWFYKLSLESAYGTALKNMLKDFDESTLRNSIATVKKGGKKNAAMKQALKLESAMNDFDAYLVEKKIFDENFGMVGRTIKMASMVRDKKVFLVNLNAAKDTIEALLYVSPKSKMLNDSLKKVKNLIGGTDEIIAKRVKEGNKIRLETADKLPPAHDKNSRLEAEFARLVRARLGKKVTLIRTILNSHGWGFEKDRLGRIIKRQRTGASLIKISGKCYINYNMFEQYGNGVRFGKTRLGRYKERVNIDCAKFN